MNDIFPEMKACQPVEDPAQVRGTDKEMPRCLIQSQCLPIVAADKGRNIRHQMMQRMLRPSGLRGAL
ncbi:hypothetical protein D3C75_1294440 [compost metagenome]